MYISVASTIRTSFWPGSFLHLGGRIRKTKSEVSILWIPLSDLKIHSSVSLRQALTHRWRVEHPITTWSGQCRSLSDCADDQRDFGLHSFHMCLTNLFCFNVSWSRYITSNVSYKADILSSVTRRTKKNLRTCVDRGSPNRPALPQSVNWELHRPLLCN